MGLHQFLDVKSRPRSNLFFLVFMGLRAHSKTIILTAVQCKNDFICPESRRTYIATVSKILLLPIELKLFSARFGPLELRNYNKNFVCLSVVCLWSYLYEIWYTCVSMGTRDPQEEFLKFWLFRFLLDFWELANFWGEVP